MHNTQLAANPSIVRDISAGRELGIGPTSGVRTIFGSKNIFTGGVDGNFKTWELDRAGVSKEATAVSVYEQVRDAKFPEIFGSLISENRGRLLFTQDQIVEFVDKEYRWLRADHYPTFFLFTENRELFVALVRLYEDGLPRAFVSRFDCGYIWYAKLKPRLVVPKLDFGTNRIPVIRAL